MTLLLSFSPIFKFIEFTINKYHNVILLQLDCINFNLFLRKTTKIFHHAQICLSNNLSAFVSCIGWM